MEPRTARLKLALFVEALPEAVFSALLDRRIELNLLPLDIASAHGLVYSETGNLSEGVRRVLAGEESAANFASFLETDERVMEDNREKIPEIAAEIQEKIFDPVLPILKEAGLPVKEGTAAPAGKLAGAPSAPERPGDAGPSANLEARHLRTLIRVAAGTAYTEEKLLEKFRALPRGLQQAVTSVDTANAVEGIAKRRRLHVDQMAALASETGLVLLGFTHPSRFVGNLAKRLRLPEEKAREIAREISGEIFLKVREALRALRSASETLAPKQEVWGVAKTPAAPEAKPRDVPAAQREESNALLAEQQKEKTSAIRPTNVPRPLAASAARQAGLPARVRTEADARQQEQQDAALTPYSEKAAWSAREAGKETFGKAFVASRTQGEKELAKEEDEQTETREELLSAIEHPAPAPARPSYIPKTQPRPAEGAPEGASESARAALERKISKPGGAQASQERTDEAAAPARGYAADPYREPLE